MAQLSPRIIASLRKVPDIARAAAARAMEEGAAEIVEAMKQAVPVDQGDLRDSIGWAWPKDVPAGSFVIDEIRSGKNKGREYATLRIVIYAGGKNAFYGRFVEFGTKTGLPAQPFFFSTWANKRADFRRRIRDAVKQAIREALRNG